MADEEPKQRAKHYGKPHASHQQTDGKWIPAFLKAYEENNCIMSRACDAVPVDRRTVKVWREKDPEFEAAIEECKERLRDKIRHTILERSLDGTTRPIYQGGKLVGGEKVYDNKLLMWMAERQIPEEFHINQRLELGSGEKPLVFKFELGEAKGELLEEAEVVEAEAIEETEPEKQRYLLAPDEIHPDVPQGIHDYARRQRAIRELQERLGGDNPPEGEADGS